MCSALAHGERTRRARPRSGLGKRARGHAGVGRALRVFAGGVRRLRAPPWTRNRSVAQPASRNRARHRTCTDVSSFSVHATGRGGGARAMVQGMAVAPAGPVPAGFFQQNRAGQAGRGGQGVRSLRDSTSQGRMFALSSLGVMALRNACHARDGRSAADLSRSPAGPHPKEPAGSGVRIGRVRSKRSTRTVFGGCGGTFPDAARCAGP